MSSKDQVEITTEAPGYQRSTTHEELAEIYKENLERDFAAFRSSHSATSRKLGVPDLLQTIQAFRAGRRPPKHLTILVIKDGKAHAVPITKTQPSLTTKRVKYIIDGLANATERGMQLPDSIVALNTWDEPRCQGVPNPCTVPVFSLIKEWDFANDRAVQTDILIPFFSHFYGDLISFPWRDKVPKALMRAAAQNGMHRNCTRLWLLQLAKTPSGQRLLDVGITNNLKTGLKVDIADYVDIPSHAKWKYLLSTDGFTSSCRFGKLLQTDSVVLKEDSRWIEYYYRSVRPSVHYVPFHKNNVMEVLEDLERKSDQELQGIAEAARHFGHRYLGTFSKTLYFARAIRTYNDCFLDNSLGEFVSSLTSSDMESIAALTAAMTSRRGAAGESLRET